MFSKNGEVFFWRGRPYGNDLRCPIFCGGHVKTVKSSTTPYASFVGQEVRGLRENVPDKGPETEKIFQCQERRNR
jgi:hypothetical protein